LPTERPYSRSRTRRPNHCPSAPLMATDRCDRSGDRVGRSLVCRRRPAGALARIRRRLRADGESAATIIVTLRNASGNPTPGRLVTIADGRCRTRPSPGPRRGVTDSNGQIQLCRTDQGGRDGDVYRDRRDPTTISRFRDRRASRTAERATTGLRARARRRSSRRRAVVHDHAIHHRSAGGPHHLTTRASTSTAEARHNPAFTPGPADKLRYWFRTLLTAPSSKSYRLRCGVANTSNFDQHLTTRAQANLGLRARRRALRSAGWRRDAENPSR